MMVSIIAHLFSFLFLGTPDLIILDLYPAIVCAYNCDNDSNVGVSQISNIIDTTYTLLQQEKNC